MCTRGWRTEPMQHMRYTQQNRQRKRQRQRETSDAKVWQASMASMVTSWVFHRNLFSLEVWGRCSPRVRDQTWLTTAAVVVPVSPMLPATAVAVVTACSQMYRQSVRPLHVPVRLLPVCLCVCVVVVVDWPLSSRTPRRAETPCFFSSVRGFFSSEEPCCLGREKAPSAA